MPAQLGAFSNPQDPGTFAGYQMQGGLSLLGERAQVNCAAYSATGNAVQDQYCAAVNFLSNQCIQPTPGQAQMLGSAQQSAWTGASPSLGSSFCSGSLGQAQTASNFTELTTPGSVFAVALIKNYSNGVSSLDSTNTNANAEPLCPANTPSGMSSSSSSSSSSNLNSNSVPGSLGSSASAYTTSTCWVTSSASTVSCSQSLNVLVTRSHTAPLTKNTCTAGQLVGSQCQTSNTSSAQSILVCPSGFTQSGGECSSTVNVAAASEQSCPLGSLWSSIDQNCSISVTVTSNALATPQACLAQQTQVGSNCVQTITEPATADGLGCPQGQALMGINCALVEQVVNAAAAVTSCAAGDDLVSGVCIHTTSLQAKPVYTCAPGATLSAQSCTSVNTQAQSLQPTCNGWGVLSAYLPPNLPYQCRQVQTQFNCEQIAPLIGLSFVAATNVSGQQVCVFGPTWSLACPSGTTLTNGVCVQTITTVASIGSYSCSAGVLSGQLCLVNTNSQAQINYSCPAQAVLSQSGGNYSCTALTTVLTPATAVFVCSAGFVLNQQTCTQVLSTPALMNYSCTPPSLLSGQNCLSTSNTLVPPLISYSCPQGGTLLGNMCTQTTQTAATSQWLCPAGSELEVAENGSIALCLSTSSTPAQIIEYCSSGQTPGTAGCLQSAVSTSWTDGCAALEQSAGAMIVVQ